MKTLLVFLLLSSAAMANDDWGSLDSGSSFSSSGSLSNFDFTPTATTTYETPNFGGGGGAIEISLGNMDTNSRQSPSLFGGSNPSNPFSISSGTNTSSEPGGFSLFGSDGIASSVTRITDTWSPSNSPLVENIMGLSASRADSGPTQSFMSLFAHKSHIPLFLDLNGDGVRGGYMDGLLYSLFFPESTTSENRGHYTNAQGRRLKTAEVSEKWRGEIVRNLTLVEIPLTEKLKDGRDKVSVSDLTQMLNGFGDSGKIQSDRVIAFESLLRLVVMEPASSSADGPVISRIMPKHRETHEALSRKTKLSMLVMRADVDKDGKKTALPFEVATSRLFAVMALHDAAVEAGLPITDFAKDAMRAAFYGVSFEMKRLKISAEERGRIVNTFLKAVAEASPEAVTRMSEQVATDAQLEALQKGAFKSMPTMNSSHLWTKRLVSLGAAATAVGAWMMGGMSAVEFITSNVALQHLSYQGAYVALPVIGTVMTRVGLNRWVGENPQVFKNDAKNLLVNSCRALVKSK